MKYFIITLALFFLAGHAQAQTLNSKEMVEISAGETLEWDQKNKQYIARGNVEVIQGAVSIYADNIVADYKDNGKNSNVEIYKITANGNVRIKNLDATAISQKATYTVDSGYAVLTGGNLSITTKEQKITARERMEYNTVSGLAKAVGNAVIVQGTDKISAQTITAEFVKNNQGKQNLKKATAVGGVTIKTPDETLTGNNGVYNAQSNTAELKGKVKIVRGPNTLEGDRAEVNLATNISKMFGSAQKGQRVKGVFFPGSTKNN